MPPMLSEEAIRWRSQVAHAARRGDPDQLANAQRNYWTARIAQLISDGLAKAPPLTDEQLGRLAAILETAPRADTVPACR